MAPSAVLLALNLALFLYSACLVCSFSSSTTTTSTTPSSSPSPFPSTSPPQVWETTRSSAKITTSGPKTSFQLYLRLAVLMGVTWVAGLLAGGIDVETVWWVLGQLWAALGLIILLYKTFY